MPGNKKVFIFKSNEQQVKIDWFQFVCNLINKLMAILICLNQIDLFKQQSHIGLNQIESSIYKTTNWASHRAS